MSMNKSGEIKLIKQSGLAGRLAVGRTTLWSLRNSEADFPKPVKVGKSIAWRSDEVDEWIESRPRA